MTTLTLDELKQARKHLPDPYQLDITKCTVLIATPPAVVRVAHNPLPTIQVKEAEFVVIEDGLFRTWAFQGTVLLEP